MPAFSLLLVAIVPNKIFKLQTQHECKSIVQIAMPGSAVPYYSPRFDVTGSTRSPGCSTREVRLREEAKPDSTFFIHALQLFMGVFQGGRAGQYFGVGRHFKKSGRCPGNSCCLAKDQTPCQGMESVDASYHLRVNVNVAVSWPTDAGLKGRADTLLLRLL